MYNIASTSYRNLPIQAQAPKKSRESFGLLSRNAEPKWLKLKTKHLESVWLNTLWKSAKKERN